MPRPGPHRTPAAPAAATSPYLAIVALAVVGTALAVWPGFLDSFRFRNPKLLVLGVAGALAAGALAWRRRDRLRLGVADLALLGYFAAGIVSALVHDRVWTRGASWASQELAALLVFWAASHATAEAADRHARILRIVAVTASLVAALVVLEALGVHLLDAKARPVATIGNRNWVGLYLATALPLVVTRQVLAISRRGLAQLALIEAALILTRSRGAWLAVLTVAAGALVVIAWRALRRSPAPGGARRGAIAVALTSAVTVAIATSIPWPGLHWTDPAPYSGSLARLVEHDAGTGRLRADQLRVGLAIVAAHPVLGVGPLQWHDAFDEHAHAAGRDVDGSYGSPVPPSFLLRITVETGVVGLLGFAAAMVWLVRDALRRWRVAPAERPALLATLAALLAVSIDGVFEAPLYNAESLAVIAVLAGTLRSPPGAWRVELPQSLARLALAAVATFALVIAILRAATTPTASLEATREDQRLFPMPEVVESIALGLTRRGDCRAAAAELDEAVRWSPHHVEPLVRLAYCELRAGDRDHGTDLLRRALAIDPHRRAEIDRVTRMFGVAGLSR